MLGARGPVALTGTLLIGLGVLSLRWPWTVSVETLRGRGHIDLTIVAFVASFGMIVLGLPGYAAAVAGARGSSPVGRLALAGSLLFLLTGCLATLVWIVVSVRAIGGTLTPIQIALAVLPPMVTALSAVRLRFRFQSEDRDIGL